MLSAPTLKQLQALHALKGHPAWAGFESILESELQTTMARMVDTADEATLRRTQGRCHVLKDLQKLVIDVTTLLNKQGHNGL